MNIKVLYFAKIKDSVNKSTEDITLPVSVNTIAALKNYLAKRGGVWAKSFNKDQLIRAAINQQLVKEMADINEGDEIAFFPPVTGG